MNTIYRPVGAALEYAPLALNLYRGCGHSCGFCYAPATLRMTKSEFATPKPRQGIIAALQHDAPRWLKKEPVLLSFSSDPYQPIEAEHCLARQAIEILHFYGFPVALLTKAGALAQRDFDLLTAADKFGVTLTFTSEADSRHWEPGAALPRERLANLQEAHRRGIATWVSMEPVIDPAQTLELISLAAPFVDEFKVGKLNHISPPHPIDWRRFGLAAIALLEKLGKRYYIKRDLRACLT